MGVKEAGARDEGLGVMKTECMIAKNSKEDIRVSAKTRTLKSVPAGSVRSRVSPEEWEMRCELAAAYQLAAQYRWTDLIFTHFTARVPGSPHILINPYGLMFDEITASSIVKIDHEGKVIDDVTGLGVN